MLSLQLGLMGDFGVSINRMGSKGLRDVCQVQVCLMGKVGTCRTSPCGRERCMCATQGWYSDISTCLKRKRVSSGGEPVSLNGKNSLRRHVLMEYTTATGHSQRICLRYHTIRCPTTITTSGKPTIRYVAKRCRHGLNYRMERYKLSEVTGLSYNEANRNFIIYHATTPELERGGRRKRRGSERIGRSTMQWDDDSKSSNDSTMTFSSRLWRFTRNPPLGIRLLACGIRLSATMHWPLDARIAIDVHDSLVCIASPGTIKTALRIM